MISVLQLVPVWGSGGIEKNVCNYVENMNRQIVHMDVLCFKKRDTFFDDIIKKGEVTVFRPAQDFSKKNIVKIRQRLRFIKKIVSENNYNIVHINLSSGLAFLYAYEVKRANIDSKVIIHAHGDGIDPPYRTVKKAFYFMCQLLWRNKADFCIACSQQINRWMYFRKTVESKNNKIIHYAIDTKKFVFNPVKRSEMRRRLNVDDETILIGTIGRIVNQKNPYFILRIIEGLKKYPIPFQFLWIGEGELEENVKMAAGSMQLEEKIIFLGKSNEIPSLLSAMDIFILPSLYEGLGIVNIEAQCSGMFTLVSDTTPKEARISRHYEALSIKNSEIWCKRLNELSHGRAIYDRQYPEEGIRENGFELNENVNQMQRVYEEMMEK